MSDFQNLVESATRIKWTKLPDLRWISEPINNVSSFIGDHFPIQAWHYLTVCDGCITIDYLSTFQISRILSSEYVLCRDVTFDQMTLFYKVILGSNIDEFTPQGVVTWCIGKLPLKVRRQLPVLKRDRYLISFNLIKELASQNQREEQDFDKGKSVIALLQTQDPRIEFH